jgi:hypothetical protein
MFTWKMFKWNTFMVYVKDRRTFGPPFIIAPFRWKLQPVGLSNAGMHALLLIQLDQAVVSRAAPG